MRGHIEKLDYVGFSYNGIHSSQFGLKSVSSGNRYTRNLLPATNDVTVDIIGGDGSLYFGSTLKNGSFDISLAFDDVTEQELREIARWLSNDGTVAPLIFDELPYIQYQARITGAPSVKFVAFENNIGARIYKGEGSLKFTTFDPYGYAVHKFISEYQDENIGEWSEASGLLFSKKIDGVDVYDTYVSGEIKLYNPGDVSVDFTLELDIDVNEDILEVKLDDDTFFKLNTINRDKIFIDTKRRLIKSEDSVINDVLIDGDLFKIPVGKDLKITISGTTSATIEYPYKYL